MIIASRMFSYLNSDETNLPIINCEVKSPYLVSPDSEIVIYEEFELPFYFSDSHWNLVFDNAIRKLLVEVRKYNSIQCIVNPNNQSECRVGGGKAQTDWSKYTMPNGLTINTFHKIECTREIFRFTLNFKEIKL